MFQVVLMKCLGLGFVKTAEQSLKLIQKPKEIFVKSVGTIKKRKGFVSRLINTGSVTGNNAISYMDKRVIKKRNKS